MDGLSVLYKYFTIIEYNINIEIVKYFVIYWEIRSIKL